VLDTDEDSDRRARHLANAAIGPDNTTADALHQSAERTRRRRGHATSVGQGVTLAASAHRHERARWFVVRVRPGGPCAAGGS
jgi:hypothetical protein